MEETTKYFTDDGPLIVFVITGLITIVFYIYLLIKLRRIRKVGKYRIHLLENKPEAYNDLPSFGKMCYSFKPLKDKYWIKDYDDE